MQIDFKYEKKQSKTEIKEFNKLRKLISVENYLTPQGLFETYINCYSIRVPHFLTRKVPKLVIVANKQLK